MKLFSTCLGCLAMLVTLVSTRCLQNGDGIADQLSGAWIYQNGDDQHVLLFIDGYATYTCYSNAGKKFTETRGGTYSLNENKLNIVYEFDTGDKERIGQSVAYNFTQVKERLSIENNGETIRFKKIDDGTAPLAGVWSISARMQEGNIVPIHRTGTRKTIKILSGTRFQWAAIDPGTKQFSGTGGGRYEFANGKYIEHIEFFSRDSSRVGASLSFDGKLENGEWHHSGLSSKGDKIYEIWRRHNK